MRPVRLDNGGGKKESKKLRPAQSMPFFNQTARDPPQSSHSAFDMHLPQMSLYNRNPQQHQHQPDIPRLRMPSQFLQRRLSRGCRYFDSGEYNVAKFELQRLAQVHGNSGSELLDPKEFTGDQIARPETVFGRNPAEQDEDETEGAHCHRGQRYR